MTVPVGAIRESPLPTTLHSNQQMMNQVTLYFFLFRIFFLIQK